MKKHFTLIIILYFIHYILISPSIELQAQTKGKITIAVLTITAKSGISRPEAETLCDRLRTELVNLETFTVLERAQMVTILQEQGFNQGGCTSSECAVEAGKLLGVQRMVAGDVGKIGNVLTIDIRIFDVATGKITKAYNTDYRGEIGGLLTEMKKIARQISGLKPIEEKKFPWLWTSLGLLVVGGGTAFLLLQKDKKSGSDGPGDLPDPIWPPEN